MSVLQPLSRSLRLVSTIALVAVLGTLAFARVQAVRRAALYERHGLPGQRVDIGGRSMHLVEAGLQHRGKGPTVVLEAGWGGMSVAWQHVLQQVGQFAYVIAYDRAGHGFSDDHDGPHDATAVADDLRRLLEAHGAPAPYVLVGHSLGGPYVRTFAGANAEDVAGVVLVDASHPDQLERSPALREVMQSQARLMTLLPWVARTGALRVVDVLGMPAGELYGAYRAIAQELLTDPRHLTAAAAEFKAWDASMEAARRAGDLDGIPVRILTAGVVFLDGSFAALQREFLSLGSEARLQVVEEADHYTILTDPELSLHIAAAVRDLVGRP